MAGNAAVAQALRSSPVTVQRTDESAALLEKLAVPRVAEGPAIEVQKGLAEEIEALVTNPQLHTELNLGGILVDHLPDAKDRSYLPDTDDPTSRTEQTREIYDRLAAKPTTGGHAAQHVSLAGSSAVSTGIRYGDKVKSQKLGPALMENSLKTMIDAQQFEYLRLAGLPNNEWKILVELHYIRLRPKDMAGLHKDTKGQSLFVNLNYHVPGHRVRGPEYVLNPLTSQKHDEQIFGVGETRGTLPQVFGEDLRRTRAALPSPKRIESAGAVSPLGYVAFVDEAIHHATPWYGHRYITPTELKQYLERVHPAEFAEIARAKTAFGGSYLPSFVYPFKTYVKDTIISQSEAETWRTLHTMATVDEPSPHRRLVRYTRHDFQDTPLAAGFDELVHDIGGQAGAERSSAGSGGWHSANVHGADLSPVSRRPLVRTASQTDLTKNWPAQLPDEVPRRFFRSWVRAIPAALADDIRGK